MGNRLKERLLPNGVKSVYEYDDLDRVKSIVHTNASGTVLASVTYERKGIGEPTKITREDGSFVALEYDAALRVKKESYYNAAGVLQDETSYTYDAAGKRLVQSTTRNNITSDRSYNYTAGYQLDAIAEPGETENYDYDANGRLTYIVRDGKTLDLEHDGSDRLTVVENETTGSTIQYTYDGQGRRVAATEGTAQRRFLVAPAMGSGLESTDLIADGNGNLISNYVYAGGTSPFMRLDASGNPIYYLTDAMGTVIGLANQQGQSAGKFLYDAFGNILTQVGSDNSGAAGGDFRFQGQWLEQGTGIYHFRARDYDAKTGTFLSRDPVDIIETQPESFNPYQFVYNNPHVYSDPTGMFTLVELNSTRNGQDILQTIQARAGAAAKEYIIDYAKEVVNNIALSALNSFSPFGMEGVLTALSIENPLLANVKTKIAGKNFEFSAQENLIGVFKDDSNFLDYIHLEVPVNETSGKPSGNGINVRYFRAIHTYPEHFGSNDPRPDYIIKPSSPTDDSVQSFLIGDFKLSVKTMVDQYLGGSETRQWNAIGAHTKPHHSVLPVSGFITYYSGTSAENERIRQAAFAKGMVAVIFSLVQKRGFRDRLS
ncbi:MAG TPA: hypothetical protein DCE56_28885 [Cyanobacteria bacterium UBA8553]|nr:hypothetical protein [Cyanobacteria bacterium UBA8553]